MCVNSCMHSHTHSYSFLECLLNLILGRVKQFLHFLELFSPDAQSLIVFQRGHVAALPAVARFTELCFVFAGIVHCFTEIVSVCVYSNRECVRYCLCVWCVHFDLMCFHVCTCAHVCWCDFASKSNKDTDTDPDPETDTDTDTDTDTVWHRYRHRHAHNAPAAMSIYVLACFRSSSAWIIRFWTLETWFRALSCRVARARQSGTAKRGMGKDTSARFSCISVWQYAYCGAKAAVEKHCKIHTATHCNILQRSAAHWPRCRMWIIFYTALRCNILQRTATHSTLCNILQRTAMMCKMFINNRKS